MTRPGTGPGRDTALFQFGVERGEFLGNLRFAHRLNPLVREFARQTDAAVSTFQPLPFIRGYDDERVASMLGDDDGLAPGLVAQSAEGLLKFVGTGKSAFSSFYPNICFA
ncbi:hypothetical protein [Methylocystis sp. S23]